MADTNEVKRAKVAAQEACGEVSRLAAEDRTNMGPILAAMDARDAALDALAVAAGKAAAIKALKLAHKASDVERGSEMDQWFKRAIEAHRHG